MQDKEKNFSYKDMSDLFKYDISKGQLIWVSSRKQRYNGRIAGSVNNYGYRMVEINHVAYCVHRIVWLLKTKEWPKGQIDHINGNKDDNHFENLREVTARENCQNRRKNRGGKLPGAYYHSRDRKWHAQIKLNYKSTYISTHDTELEAHKAYLNKIEELKKEGVL